MAVSFRVSPPVAPDALAALFREAWPDGVTRDFRPLLARAAFHVCAFDGKQLVGFAKVVDDGGVHGFLLDPTVRPSHRRRGIGRRLVKRCAAEARARGLEWLHVDFEPQLAAFYQACGFAPSTAGLMRIGKNARTARGAVAKRRP
jgi:GNAT superfamily N-acetyltransferase